MIFTKKKERIPEENDFDQVVPETFNESSDAKAAMSKKSQFEDLLNSKQNELGLEVKIIFKECLLMKFFRMSEHLVTKKRR